MRAIRRAGRLAVLALPLFLAWLAAQSPLYDRVEAWLQDASQGLLAREHHFEQALVVEIDEASLTELRPYLGSWPYSRDVYALLLDYLGEMQVRAVFFDILFADPRPGDDALRAALGRNPQAMLAATALREPVAGESDPVVLGRLAWPVDQGPRATPLPALEWPAAALPLPLLGGGASLPRVGMISFEYDADGILRRVPLLHRIDGRYLPSAVLSALHPGAVPEIVGGRGSLVVGGTEWPVGEDGTVGLVYPSNPHPLRTMPFATLVKAAMGERGHALDPALFRDKAVFVGTTALFSDHVNTPRGVMNGVHVLAMAYSALAQGLYLAPPRISWNMALVLLAMLPLGGAIPASLRGLLGTALAVAAILAAHFGLLASGQATLLGVPLLVALSSGLVATLRAARAAARATAEAAQEQIEHQQKIVALVSHELKSPLATIDLTLQNLERVDGLPPSVLARHQKLRRASRRLAEMIEDNLAEDRLRQRMPTSAKEAVGLADVIDEIVRAADRSQIELVSGAAAPAVVYGDRGMLRVAFANLLGNAIKYSPDGTPVRIELAIAGREVEVRVIDHGCGIADEDQAHIFEPYYRAAGIRQPGSGLGLALVRQIVEAHGGTIRVASSPGEGAAFVVQLPLAPGGAGTTLPEQGVNHP